MGHLGVEVYAPVRAARRATCGQADDRATPGGGMVHDLVVTVALHRDDPVVEPQAHARPQHPLRVARGVEVRAGLVDPDGRYVGHRVAERSEEHTSELQSLMRISYAVFCLKKKKKKQKIK